MKLFLKQFRLSATRFILMTCLASVSISFTNIVLARADDSEISSNRFLFIVETSAAMKRKLPETLKTMNQILASSASGQLRLGDTIGLWTFNTNVYAEFPLQTWGETTTNDLSRLFKSFMEHQRFTNVARLDKALKEMHGVINASEIITVVVIYTGEDKVKGTPFDQPLNDLIKKNAKASRRDTPVVFTLEANHGTIFNYAVSAPPWPIEFPLLPQPTPLPEATPKPAPTPVVEIVKPLAPVTILPPLILSGPQKNTVTSPTPAPVLVAPVAPPVSEPVALAPTVQPQTLPPLPSSPVIAETVSSPPPVSIPATVLSPTPAPKPSPTPVNEPLPVTSPVVSQVQTPAPPSAAAPVAAVKDPVDSTATSNEIASAPLASAVLPATTRPTGYLIAGLVLVMVAVGLIALMLKKSRRNSGSSFISRSISKK